MARIARDARLNSATARLKLKVQPEPYWRQVQAGSYLGYRKIASKAGTWIARHYDPTRKRKMLFQALGTADDLDGGGLSFDQAQDAAREWFASLATGQEPEKPWTVRDATTAYLVAYQRRSGLGTKELTLTVNAHILPTFGDVELAKLTVTSIRAWHQKLAETPARLRGGKVRNLDDMGKEELREVHRARKVTANRILTTLKAALNYAFREEKVDSDLAWRRIEPFKKVEEPKERHLTDDESQRLVQACPPDLAAIVSGALFTGCRYGELAAMRVERFNDQATQVRVYGSKTGKERMVTLTDEGTAFFRRQVADKEPEALVFERVGTLQQATKSGPAVKAAVAWGKSDQFRPLREACARAGIVPAIGFHILRHTYASRLVMRGMPMPVIAAQIGDSLAITARHYAHLTQSHVADIVRKLSGDIGLGQQPGSRSQGECRREG